MGPDPAVPGSGDAAGHVAMAGRRWGSHVWVPCDAWGHAFTLLLPVLVAEGAEPAAPRKSVSPRAELPGMGGHREGHGTRHQHHGGQRGWVSHASCAQIQGGIAMFSDTGWTQLCVCWGVLGCTGALLQVCWGVGGGSCEAVLGWCVGVYWGCSRLVLGCHGGKAGGGSWQWAGAVRGHRAACWGTCWEGTWGMLGTYWGCIKCVLEPYWGSVEYTGAILEAVLGLH